MTPIAAPAAEAPAMFARALHVLNLGGPALWVIAALSVAALALALWKLGHLLALGVFGGQPLCARALDLWSLGDATAAQTMLAGSRKARAKVALAAMRASGEPQLARAGAEAATEQAALAILVEARSGLRGLELAAAVGPLLGLLGTVIGMISAFQGLEAAGVRADTAALAGGIWEALLTTAAGMAVAIPAMVALAWFDGVLDRLRHDMEAAATAVFLGQDRLRAAPPRAAVAPRIAAVDLRGGA